MSVSWQISFRVSETQNFDDRWAENYGDGSQFDPSLLPDIQKAKDLVLSQITDTNQQQPYAIFLGGQRDYARPGDVSISVDVQPSP